MNIQPKATHSGTWEINGELGLLVQCYVMDNGERVLSLRGSSRAIGLVGGGSTAMVRSLSARWIAPYLSEELKAWLSLAARNELPDYISDKGTKFSPIGATTFMDVCKAYADAMMSEPRELTDKQREIAERAYAIMVAFAKVGLVAIIDEVTGYQDDRDRTELQKILEKYISAELMPWTKRFPDEFYKQMFRLKGWEYKGKAKSPLVGKLTNEFVYNYLPEGVLQELRAKNPKNSSGHRKDRHHQYLADTGAKHLDNLLQQEMALMKASDDWDEFVRLFKKSMGEPYQITIEETTDRK